MIYQKNKILLIAALLAAGANVVKDETLGRIAIVDNFEGKLSEAGAKITFPQTGSKVTKLESVMGSDLLSNLMVRDAYKERVSGTLEGDFDVAPKPGVKYQAYEIEHSPISTDHGGYLPALRPKFYLYVNSDDATKFAAFESALASAVEYAVNINP